MRYRHFGRIVKNAKNDEDNVKIACIAWGSLLWKPGPLKLASEWQPDGPLLPLEFVRDSDDSDQLALVLHEPAPLMPTYWAWLATENIASAREMLRQREKIRPQYPQWVGSIPDPNGQPAQSAQRVAAWMRAIDIEAAVWTAAPGRVLSRRSAPTVPCYGPCYGLEQIRGVRMYAGV